MIIWVRNVVIIFLVLSAIYVALSLRARLKQRDKLSAEFESSDKLVDKQEFVASGLQKYNKSFRPKLIFGVYLVPIAIIAVLIYLAQYT